jgi:hypothetical protein
VRYVRAPPDVVVTDERIKRVAPPSLLDTRYSTSDRHAAHVSLAVRTCR